MSESDWMWTVKRWPYVQNLAHTAVQCSHTPGILSIFPASLGCAQTSSWNLHSCQISFCQYSHIFVSWFPRPGINMSGKWITSVAIFGHCFLVCTASLCFCVLFFNRFGGSVDIGLRRSLLYVTKGWIYVLYICYIELFAFNGCFATTQFRQVDIFSCDGKTLWSSCIPEICGGFKMLRIWNFIW